MFKNCTIVTKGLKKQSVTADGRQTNRQGKLGVIPVKFGQNPMSGFRGEDV